MRPVLTCLLAGVLAAWAAVAGAQTQNQTASSSSTTTAAGTTPSAPVRTLGGAGSPAETRLVSGFTSFAGSEENARSLVTGLRQGSEITLTSPTAGGSGGTGTTTGTSFTPPTRPMGYGNIRIALALAQEQLTQAGITQPTPSQLQTALMGGTITTTGGTTSGTTATTSTDFRGVLQMRADGMGWGQIANSMGVKLGQVLTGRTAPPPPTGAGTTTTTTSNAGSSAGSGTGITTATGATTTTTLSRGNGAAAQQAHRPGAGIVNAAGGASFSSASTQGGGNGSGIVTGAGASAGGRAAASGRALGKGLVNQ